MKEKEKTEAIKLRKKRKRNLLQTNRERIQINKAKSLSDA